MREVSISKEVQMFILSSLLFILCGEAMKKVTKKVQGERIA